MALGATASQHSAPNYGSSEWNFFQNYAVSPTWLLQSMPENSLEKGSPSEQTPSGKRPFGPEFRRCSSRSRSSESSSLRDTSSNTGSSYCGEENAFPSHRRGSLGCKPPAERQSEEDMQAAEQTKAAAETLHPGAGRKRIESNADETRPSAARWGNESFESSTSSSNVTLRPELTRAVGTNGEVRKCEMSYVVKMPLDGFRPADLTLSARDGKLCVMAVRQDRREGEEWRCAVLREYVLPPSVDLWRVDARIESGRTLVFSAPFGNRTAEAPTKPVSDAAGAVEI